MEWINGTGLLRGEDVDLGDVQYKILVGPTRATGRLWGAPDVLDQAYKALNLELTLPEQRSVRIAITTWTAGQDASFVVNDLVGSLRLGTSEYP